MKLIMDERYQIIDITPVNSLDRVQRVQRDPFVLTPSTNAVHIACFVTDYARDLLYEFMRQLPAGTLLYTDTVRV
jgi:hypothetical protein